MKRFSLALNFNFNLKLSLGLLIIYAATWLIDLFTLQAIPTSAVILCIGALFVYILFLSRIDTKYYVGIAVFTFFAQYLGGMLNFYKIIPIYDNILHLASGVLLVLLADYVYSLIIRPHKNYSAPTAVRIGFGFLASVASAAAWEIWEYSGDTLLGLSSQGGLDDTMTDIIAGTIGAVIGIFVMILLLKKERK